jgi:hydrogenase expression/formation protein HypC
MCLAVPGKIVEITENDGLQMAKVDFGGIFREACLDYVPEAKVGDYCVIHVGFAISLLSEKPWKPLSYSNRFPISKKSWDRKTQ